MPAVGFKSFEQPDIAYLIDGERRVKGSDVLVASGQTSTLTPSYLLGPGTVVVKVTATGKWYQADHATLGDRNAAASVTSLIDITDPKSTTFKWIYKGGAEQTFTAGGGDTDIDKLITALNADDNFQANLVATKPSASKLKIATKTAGRDEYFKVTDGTLNDLGGAQATFADNAFWSGTDADYRVLAAYAPLQELNAAAQDFLTESLRAGNFRTASLSNLTAEAKAVLARNGSFFG